ncbi:ketosteroid isomerase [Enterococcus sp. JM4C]|uniref:nuclear transport factor 2 family protein n=1 Tax=Candidatus Enterococcus huntleyi TaxID=1857217 RepID=UPI00137A9ECA|nr:nuclear transport factor 2 family protein [Enterococcus sp. JM4C]KAF1299599.1 ketosteroid isomerase [Enterococcus sp. JM4C]
MTQNVIEVFNAYNKALSEGDFPAVFATMADDIKWHQPGNNTLSGEIIGKERLGQHLGAFAERSNGTFKIRTNWVSSNDCFVAVNVTFLAQKKSADLNMDGFDLFKIEAGKIKEVWLFSAEQQVEDDFWG